MVSNINFLEACTDVPNKVNTFIRVYNTTHVFVVNGEVPILEPEDIHIGDLVNVECNICQFKIASEGAGGVKKWDGQSWKATFDLQRISLVELADPYVEDIEVTHTVDITF